MTFIEKFRSISVERQILITVASMAAIGAAIFSLYNIVLKPHYGVLASNLRPADAATVVGELDKKKTPYQLRDGGQTVLVPLDLVDKSRIDLMNGNLPLKGTVGFELFDKSDMGVTEFAQKINYQRALQGELERTIMSMDEIEEARVHLALSEPSIFRDDQKPSKASVTILTKQDNQLSDRTVLGIQRLIAAAVPDLDASNVVVLDNRGVIVSKDEPDILVSATPTASDSRQAVEDNYEDRLRKALFQIYPDGGFSVTVMAGVDPSRPPVDGDARNYPLHVSVMMAGPVTPDQEQAIRMAVLHEINADPNLGDAITVGSSTIAAPTPPIPRNSPPQVVAASKAALPLDMRSAIFAISFCLLIGGALFFGRGRSVPRPLTAKQRQAYADRLKHLLERGGLNAIS